MSDSIRSLPAPSEDITRKLTIAVTLTNTRDSHWKELEVLCVLRSKNRLPEFDIEIRWDDKNFDVHYWRRKGVRLEKGPHTLVMIVSMDKRGDLKEREEFLQDVLSRAFDRALERYDRERDAKAGPKRKRKGGSKTVAKTGMSKIICRIKAKAK